MRQNCFALIVLVHDSDLGADAVIFCPILQECHHGNIPIQITLRLCAYAHTAIYYNFQMKKCDIFFKNMVCEYS